MRRATGDCRPEGSRVFPRRTIWGNGGKCQLVVSDRHFVRSVSRICPLAVFSSRSSMFPGSRREAGKKTYRPRDTEVCLICEEPLVSVRPPWRAGLPDKESCLFFGNSKYSQARRLNPRKKSTLTLENLVIDINITIQNWNISN